LKSSFLCEKIIFWIFWFYFWIWVIVVFTKRRFVSILGSVAANHGERMRGLVVRDSRRAVVLSESER